MKLQHNSSGESSEDLIALIIAVRRERERERKGKHEEEEEERKEGSRGEESRSDVIEELVREPDVAGVIQVCLFACEHITLCSLCIFNECLLIFTHALFSACMCWRVNMRSLGPCE